VGLAGESVAWDGWFAPADAPSLSDRYARFYLAAQQKASELDPDAKAGGLAYANYWTAPKQTKLRRHGVVAYVPPWWRPCTERRSRERRRHWDGWRAAAAPMMFRPNLPPGGHAVPGRHVQPVVDDLKCVGDTGSIAVDFVSLIRSW